MAEALDARAFRTTLGRFATGIAVVTYAAHGTFRGVTVNSFTAVSLDPPLVLVALTRSSRSLRHVRHRPFAVNVLAETQLTTALEFAGRPQPGHRTEWVVDAEVPRIKGSLAHFICTPWREYDGGDHTLLLGQVASFGAQEEPGPLLFYRGRWSAMEGLAHES